MNTYKPYWNRAVERWGSRGIDQVTSTEMETFVRSVMENAVQRRNWRGGYGTALHCIAALRCLYRRAVADGYLTEVQNPASKVAKPRQLSSARRALSDERLSEINQVAANGGDNPALDSLILRLHVETACRRGGALALRPMDLDVEQCLVSLREKGGTFRLQPVSPTLMSYLVAHAEEHGCPRNERLLRSKYGRPIGPRRYDILFKRIRDSLPWAAAMLVSAHWLRHTTLTWVERRFGYAIARGFAGHAEPRGDAGATAGYVKATLEEIAFAVSALTAERHPLVPEWMYEDNSVG